MSRLTRTTLTLVIFFAIDKALAILRQVIIARQFGLSTELDAFNAANNLPDLLFALISGGALAMAFIPVLSEYLTLKNRPAAWDLFSRIANLAFLVTGALAVVTALASRQIVGAEAGIAPGFDSSQQDLVAELMRLNLIATLIFSISGLAMAGLQANQHFLFPAIAPILYNLGQIFGALILAPGKDNQLGPIHLPGFGLGVHGLVYGVIIGAALHLLIQVPALIKYQFRWTPRIGLSDPGVRQVLRLLGPRLLTMLFIQLTFIARDNLASRLAEGAVTALTYGWMIMQVPETLIGTAVATALLPTLAEQAAGKKLEAFRQTVERAARVLIALTIPAAAVLAVGISPLIGKAFDFGETGTILVTWVTIAYLGGIAGHSLLEIGARSFYAQQEARLPLLASAINALLFAGLAWLLMPILAAVGIALANTLAFTSEAVLLFFLLKRRLPTPVRTGSSLPRALASGALAAGIAYAVMQLLANQPVIGAIVGMGVGFLCGLPFIWREIRLMARL